MRRRRFVAALLALAAVITFAAPAAAQSAWEREVVYHIFPRSYRDSDGDRIGDFRGIAAGLDAIERLGCTTILLAPYGTPQKLDR